MTSGGVVKLMMEVIMSGQVFTVVPEYGLEDGNPEPCMLTISKLMESIWVATLTFVTRTGSFEDNNRLLSFNFESFTGKTLEEARDSAMKKVAEACGRKSLRITINC